MKRTIPTLLLTMIVLFTLVGKAVAESSHSCSMMMSQNSVQMNHMAMGEMDHAHHQMMVDSQQSADCCEDNCYCPTNACSSAAAIIEQLSLNSQRYSDKPLQQESTAPVHKINSLFRPPILA